MQNPIDPLNTDYVILFQPVLVPKQAIQSLSVMPISLPPQPIPVQEAYQIHKEEQPMQLPQHKLQSQNAQYVENKIRKGPATDKQMNTVLNIANQKNMTESEVCQLVGAKSYAQMSNAQANDFISNYKDAKPQF